MLGSIIVLLIVLAVVYHLFLSYRPDSRKELRLKEPVPVAKVLSLGFLRAAGRLSGRMSGPVTPMKLMMDVELTAARVAAYQRVSVFRDGAAAARKAGAPSQLSVCFPQVVSVGLAPVLLVDRGFPLSPLGILHMRQTIVQHEALTPSGKYGIEVFFARYPTGLMFEETERGVELTIRVLLSDRRQNGKTVWEGDTVVVSRGRPLPRRRNAEKKVFESPVWDSSSVHAVDGATGRRYAAATGEYNPHHLYWWSALPFGFSRPIAHGMWTLAAAVHELQATGRIRDDLYPLRVSCDFKKPLLMPAEVTLGYRSTGNRQGHFGVYDKRNEAPHLIGSFEQ